MIRLVSLCVAAVVTALAPTKAPISLNEAGSTSILPVAQAWAQGYNGSAKLVPSGGGDMLALPKLLDGSADLVFSDVPLPAQWQGRGLIDIPVAIGAQLVIYHLAGFPQSSHLRLSGAAVAAMFDGSITRWNDARIAALNPGVALPNIPVVPIYRAENSGDTQLFTEFLSRSDATWAQGVGSGTSVAWPAAAKVTDEWKSNAGLLDACVKHDGCVTYLAVTYVTSVSSAGLGYAALQTGAGDFVPPTRDSIAASGSSAYPMVNFERAYVVKHQRDAARSLAIKAFLRWAIDTNGGSDGGFLFQSVLMPLNPDTRAQSAAQIETIT